MSWVMYHAEAERFASLAEAALRQRDFQRATELYRLAAEQEALALRDVDPSKARTLGITAVSVAALWYKAHEFRQAQLVAHQFLANESVPKFAVEQLRHLLEVMWHEESRAQAGIEFTEGEVLVSVSGGDIVTGGAPLELILRKVDEVSRILYRTIEMLLDLPIRRRGAPSSQIQEQFRPWLFQVPAGSYQFAVRVERPKQMSLFPELAPTVDQITQKFLEVVRASADDPEGQLTALVPNEEYRDTFLKLTRNLTPTGKVFGRLEMKTSSDIGVNPIVLVPAARESINSTLRKAALERRKEDEREEVQLRGVLRGLQLDSDWLEIHLLGDESRTVRVYDTGDVIDDVVGPMVNHGVVVNAILKPNGKYYYRDIQPEE